MSDSKLLNATSTAPRIMKNKQTNVQTAKCVFWGGCIELFWQPWPLRGKKRFKKIIIKNKNSSVALTESPVCQCSRWSVSIFKMLTESRLSGGWTINNIHWFIRYSTELGTIRLLWVLCKEICLVCHLTVSFNGRLDSPLICQNTLVYIRYVS